MREQHRAELCMCTCVQVQIDSIELGIYPTQYKYLDTFQDGGHGYHLALIKRELK